MTTEPPERRPFDPRQFLEATARHRGLTFEPGALDTASAELGAAVERGEDGQIIYTSAGYASAFRIEGGAVIEVPVGETIAALIQRHAKPAIPPVPVTEATPPAPTGSSSHYSENFGPKATAAADAALIAEAQGWPNPWSEKTLNRTRQTVLRNRLPQLAVRYQAEAAR